jgi:GAF domain-containing protein
LITNQGDILTDYEIAEEEIKALIADTPSDQVLKVTISYLYEHFEKYNWVGIYIIKGNDLVLSSWRGQQATEHTRIPIGKGICGAAAETGKTELISDVSQDDRYLACFLSTKSEIVVPIQRNGKVVGEIDIDSDVANAFNECDVVFLEKIANELSTFIY